MALSASDLYAVSQGLENKGRWECHWCGSKCDDKFLHDEKLAVPFEKNTIKQFTRRPANPYICSGCSLFRRKRLTARNLSGTSFKDGQCPVNLSWWITRCGAWSIGQEDHEALYEHLLNPPHLFVLSLLEGCKENHIQLAVVNDFCEVKADTQLSFTINNIPHVYTTQELEMGIRKGPNGRMPGVGALMKILGGYDKLPPLPDEEARNRGRPPPKMDGKSTKKTVALSGFSSVRF